MKQKNIAGSAISNELKILELQSEIAELKAQNLQLQDLENRFKVIADTAPVLVWMSDTDKLCTYFNKGWLEFTGRTLEQEYGNGWAEGVHPEDFNRCLEIYITSFDRRVPFSMQYRLKRNDGKYRWILDNGVPRYSLEGEFLGYIGSCVDINEQRVLNQELQDRNIKLNQKNKELTAFNYIATHDLQEPLQTLINYSTLINAQFPEVISPVVSSYLEKIREEAEKTKELIATLLQYTLLKDDSNWQKKSDLNQLLNEALTSFSENSKKPTIQSNSLPALKVVPWHITKVFSNLISNSVRFSREDAEPMITVTARKISSGLKENPGLRDESYWEISFEDNGIGFEKKYNDIVFEVFQKVGNSPNCGHGVGLAIVKKIMNNHGGEIFADSTPGKGTCFRLYFPDNV